jgi:predicted transcriptional regulator
MYMDKLLLSVSGPASVRLGPLECRILEEVWACESLTVRELMNGGRIRLAYTTVMTTLDRLFKKGLLDRAEDGKAFRYSARCTPANVSRFVAVAGMQRWIRSSPVSFLPLSCFVDAITAHDARLLDELRVLVEQKRSELRKQNGRQP